jgi:hypothetical protein
MFIKNKKQKKTLVAGFGTTMYIILGSRNLTTVLPTFNRKTNYVNERDRKSFLNSKVGKQRFFTLVSVYTI